MVSLIPVVAWSSRNQSQNGVRSVMFPRDGPRAGSLGAFARVPQECRRRDIPLLLGLDELAGPVPVRDGLGHELPPRAVALLQPHGRPPWLSQDGLQRHLEGRPFRVGEALLERGVVVEPADAVALLQRRLGLVL